MLATKGISNALVLLKTCSYTRFASRSNSSSVRARIDLLQPTIFNFFNQFDPETPCKSIAGGPDLVNGLYPMKVPPAISAR